MQKENGKKLSSWKEIADYLGYSVRSCRRLEKKTGLPIYRVGSGRNPRVFAFSNELDSWLRGKANAPEDPDGKLRNGQKRRIFIPFAVVVILAMAFGTYLFLLSSSSQPADFSIRGSFLVIKDARGKELWSFDSGLENLEKEAVYRDRFQIKHTTSDGSPLWPLILIEDINNDKNTEVVFSSQTESQLNEGWLYCFDHKGNELWIFEAGGAHRFGDHLFSNDYRIEGIAPFDLNNDGKLEFCIIGAHMDDFPTRLAYLDCRGSIIGEYWNSGRILDLASKDLNNDGKPELLAVGTNNEYGKACLIVFDPDRIEGCSPQRESNYICGDFAKGTEISYVLFPRTPVDRAAFRDRETMQRIELLKDAGIKVVASSSRLCFELNDRLEAQHITATYVFKQKYDQFRREGIIKESFDPIELESLKKGLLYWTGREWSLRPAVNSNYGR